MKRFLKNWKLPLRARTALLGLVVILTSAGPVAAERFQNFANWQEGRFHGFTALPTMTDTDWAALQFTGANLVRVFVKPAKLTTVDRYVLSNDLLRELDRVVAQARRRNIKVVPTIAALPKAPNNTYWASSSEQQSLVDIERAIAARYRGDDVIAGLDIINEPYPANVQPPSIRDQTWNNFATRIIRAVRGEDPTRVIVYEWPRWDGMYTDLWAMPFDGVVYSTHWYQLRQITHQRVTSRYPDTLPYPLPADMSPGPWDKASMRAILKMVRDFQVRYHKPIFLGEFSCARWAPGSSSYNWDSDVISIFDQWGWNWTYHMFRGKSYWDAEKPHGLPTDVRSMNTNLMRFLRGRFAALNP